MVIKEVEFVSGYPLRFDWNGIESMTIALDTPAFTDIDRIISKGNFGPVSVRLILWAGLLHKHPDLKKEEVSKLIDAYLENHTLKDLSLTISKALIASGLLGTESTGADTGEVPEQSKT